MRSDSADAKTKGRGMKNGEEKEIIAAGLKRARMSQWTQCLKGRGRVRRPESPKERLASHSNSPNPKKDVKLI